MVRKKKSMIGFDPLAWLDSDGATQSSEKESPEKNKTNAVNEALSQKNTGYKKNIGRKQNVKNMITIMGHDIDEVALLKGYDLASGVMHEVVIDFYDELFVEHPEVKSLFDDFSADSQPGMLVAALRLLIDNIHNEATLKTSLSAMGERHQKYGVLKYHYPIVVELLLSSLKNKIGRSWTKAVSAAWEQLLICASEIMCVAYNENYTNESATGVNENEAINVEAEKVNDDESDNEKSSSLPVIQLQTVQDISRSQALKNDILSMLNDHDEIDIDASAVERIDGSALQLLCALFEYAQKNNIDIHWIKPSEVFIESANTLGIQKILELGG